MLFRSCRSSGAPIHFITTQNSAREDPLMLYTIHNDALTVAIDGLGAQLMSIKIGRASGWERVLSHV